MRIFNIKYAAWPIIAMSGILLMVIMNSCVESQQVRDKTGVKLWAENCQRCHNTPTPNTFSHEQWITIGMHMQTRAQITDTERDKIVAFLTQ